MGSVVVNKSGNKVTRVRKPAAVAAAVAISLSSAFIGAPVSGADPYDDDGGSSYSDDGGGMEESAGGGGMAAEPSGGGMADEPGGGGMADEPGGGGMAEEPGGGMEESAGGGGMADEPSEGGMAEEPGGGMAEEPGGGMLESTEIQASQEDVSAAMASEVVSTTSSVVSTEEITSYRETFESTLSSSTVTSGTTGLTLTSPVARWNSGWTSYDRFYRPVFTNPYRTPLNLLYDFGGQTQVVTIPPLQRAAVDVPQPGVYSFTSMSRPASGPATNMAVGSFSGGGYQPAPGQPAPQNPAKLNAIKNALVQVKFARGSSEPFTVKSLVDLGKDASLDGATKVLLDDEIPAWGQWSKTQKGTPLFEITETQLLPGVNPPGQEALPGYQVQLTASGKSMSWIGRHQTTLISVAAGAGVLALVGVAVLTMRRRRGAQ